MKFKYENYLFLIIAVDKLRFVGLFMEFKLRFIQYFAKSILRIILNTIYLSAECLKAFPNILKTILVI